MLKALEFFRGLGQQERERIVHLAFGVRGLIWVIKKLLLTVFHVKQSQDSGMVLC